MLMLELGGTQKRRSYYPHAMVELGIVVWSSSRLISIVLRIIAMSVFYQYFLLAN